MGSRRAHTGRGRDDSGQALAFVLAMVAFSGVMIVTMLSSAATGIKVGGAIRSQRIATTAADSAMEIAIQYLRADAARGTGETCPDVTGTFDGEVVVVRCDLISDVGDPAREFELIASTGERDRIVVEIEILDAVPVPGFGPPVNVVEWQVIR
jgi:hypothetical protein